MMIRQGVVQEKIDMMSMNQLPPLSSLPQWSRFNTLDRGRYPKPFIKDKLQPIQDSSHRDAGDVEEKEMDLSELNPAQRIQHLERSLVFLKQQHQDVLQSLHSEIEGLKKENKDLQFKIIMSQKAAEPTGSASSRLSHRRGDARVVDKEDKIEELRIIFLEEEIKELKHAIRETRNRNNYLTQLLEQAEAEKKRQQSTIDSLRYQLTQGNVAEVAEQIASGTNPFNMPGNREPTLAECEAIIRHLQRVNEQQSHELESLKSDLRDVLYSHKWTPDAYLLAKAYIAEDDAKEKDNNKSTLPKVPLKNQSRKLPDIAYIQKDTVSLPALHQTIGNKAVERRKRSQILQKARMRNEIIP